MKMISSYLFFFSLFISSNLFSDEVDIMPPRDQGLWQTVIMIGIAVLFFYFILWRPEQKRRKAMDQQRSSLKKGDRVTAMGIVGTVVRVQDQTVILKIFEGKIEVIKGAITDVLPGTEEEEKKAEKEERSPSNKRIDINDSN